MNSSDNYAKDTQAALHASHFKEGIIGYYKYVLKGKLLTMKVNLSYYKQTASKSQLLVCAKGI